MKTKNGKATFPRGWRETRTPSKYGAGIPSNSPDELTKLRANLAAAREEIERLYRDNENLITLNDPVYKELKEQLAAKDAEIDFQRNAHRQAQELLLEQGKQLASHQLVIQQMRDLVKQLVEATPRSLVRCRGYKCREPYCISCYDEEDAEEYLQGVFDLCGEANEALALQPNQEALEAYVKEAVEKEREECAKLCDELWSSDPNASDKNYADAIRARKDKQWPVI